MFTTLLHEEKLLDTQSTIAHPKLILELATKENTAAWNLSLFFGIDRKTKKCLPGVSKE